MGVISRKLFPACESMCICCPALRSRSRQPVKRYKKLLADIFPKNVDGLPNDRKLVKLCEYAAKNPFRIPKIAKYLEERCYKELRSEHIKFINIVTEAYNKLLCMCKEQIAYFAISLLNVVSGLLEQSKQDALLTLGCQTLTRFIYSQADGTYAHNIEKFVHNVCKLACEDGDEHHRTCLRASSLQCLSAMVWYMAEFSYIFTAFDEIVRATLDNYEPDTHNEGDDERGSPHHNWVDEVVRHDGRGAVVGNDTISSCMIIRPRPEIKDPSLLTREEIETPRVWAQVCIQRMVELAKESTTMRQILDPMFAYFDSGRDWVPQQGLAMIVLSDMCYLLESSGQQQLILAAVIRHLDHKNVARDVQLKSYVVQVAAALARQIRSGSLLAEVGFVSDLCRQLRKSLQAPVAGEEESKWNSLLQNSIENCLLEITKGIGDARPLFDMMTITLEKLPSCGAVACATIGSLTILTHMISLSLHSSGSQQVFPEALLVQILKAMLHPDVEVRVGAHQMFSVLLIPTSNNSRPEVGSLRSGNIHDPRRWSSDTASASASIAALLEKLRRERDGTNMEKHGNTVHIDYKERDIEEEWKQGCMRKSSPNFYNISSIIDRTTRTTSLTEVEPYVMKFNEDQIAQLLSALWIQANLPDNMPSNFEAIAHSFILTLISSRMKNINNNLVILFFQLPLSLRNISLDLNNGMLTPSCQRSIFVLSTGMLMFTAKIYQIPELNNLLKSLLPYDADPYLGIGDDLQVHVKPYADVKEYGSHADNQLAVSLLMELRNKISEADKAIMDIITLSLSSAIELDVDDLARQLLEPFTPDDALMFGPRSGLEGDHNRMISHSKESLSFDEDIPTGSLVEDDAMSEASVADLSRFIPKMPASPSVSHIIGVGQLLESALEVACQVAGTSVSTSPLPFDTMAKQCEVLGTGTRKKLSNWLAHENNYNKGDDKFLPAFPVNGCRASWKITNNDGMFERAVKPMDPYLAMRLPPASPFDNFLKAARC